MKTPQTPEKYPKLQFRIDLVLTVLFLAALFFMGVMTLATDFEGIYKAAVSKTRISGYLDEGWEESSAWDRLSARVRSVDDYIAGNVYGATELGYFNSSVQYAMGKRLVNTGASQMLTLNSGHLYDLQNYVSMDSAAADILAMQETAGEIPFLFVYEHPTIYSADQLPAGYDILDFSDEIAAEITEKTGALGIPMLDSREVLNNSGLELADYLLYTDQHWATRASLVMAQEIASELSAMTGINLTPEKLDISQFETETFEKLFLGKYGQRVGAGNIDPDDITIYWPKYETNITRVTNYLGDMSEQTGPFRDSVIRWKYLEPDEGKTYNIKAYFDYGLTENYDIYSNPDGAPCTILLLKDSYSASIASFLSLVADEVYAVDLRRSELSLAEWIEECNPDAVVVSYSMQMLRQDAYEFQ
ncbi:MAG: hypothetical protein IJ466_02660 [Clostridia bacterium]|nr:hypothetical protein [Clostridia bacterium]